MKTVSTLLLAFALIGSVNAQVTKKSQQTSTNKYSASSVSNNSNKNTSARSSGVTHKTTHKSNASADKASSANTSSNPSHYRVAKLEANQNMTAAKVSNIEIKNTEVKETPNGEIKKVDSKPQIYLEDKKDVVPVPFNGDSNLEVEPYVETEEIKVMPEGLSQNTTTLKNNGIRINNVIVTCDDFGIGRNRRWEILSSYEMYDLSMVKRCLNNFPEEDRWIITCDEFEKSSDVRKKYLLDNIDFYNLDHLKNCESFQNFKANLPVETEE